MTTLTRRSFLEDALLTAAAVVSAGFARPAAGEDVASTSPNEKLGVAVIGVHGRGGDHVKAFSSRKDCEVRIVCDADRDVGTRVAGKVGPNPTP